MLKNRELIIAGDNSTDGSGELVKNKFGNRVRYIAQENEGVVSAANRGISLSQGSCIYSLKIFGWTATDLYKN